MLNKIFHTFPVGNLFKHNPLMYVLYQQIGSKTIHPTDTFCHH